MIVRLLNAGADPQAKNELGDVALDYARYNPSLKVTDALKLLSKTSQQRGVLGASHERELNMTIATVLGSPRKPGNTAAVLREFESLAQPQAIIQRINITEVNVGGCRGCDACQRVADGPACAQKDDGNRILGQLIAADLIIYAAPVYVWDFPAQMKALMDRHYCLAKNASTLKATYLLHDKPTVLLTTCGGSAEVNAEVLRIIFRREMAYLRCRVVGEYVLPSCALPSELGARPHEMAQRMIKDLFLGYWG